MTKKFYFDSALVVIGSDDFDSTEFYGRTVETFNSLSWAQSDGNLEFWLSADQLMAYVNHDVDLLGHTDDDGGRNVFLNLNSRSISSWALSEDNAPTHNYAVVSNEWLAGLLTGDTTVELADWDEDGTVDDTKLTNVSGGEVTLLGFNINETEIEVIQNHSGGILFDLGIF